MRRQHEGSTAIQQRQHVVEASIDLYIGVEEDDLVIAALEETQHEIWLDGRIELHDVVSEGKTLEVRNAEPIGRDDFDAVGIMVVGGPGIRQPQNEVRVRMERLNRREQDICLRQVVIRADRDDGGPEAHAGRALLASLTDPGSWHWRSFDWTHAIGMSPCPPPPSAWHDTNAQVVLP